MNKKYHQAGKKETMTEHKKHETPQTEKPMKTGEETPETAPEIQTLKEEIAKWKDATLRAHADMENLKKRVAIDLEKNAKYANSAFAKDLLNVSDCLENALCYAKKEGEKNADFMKGMTDGIEMTYKQFQDTLKKHGIERIESMDQPFDPDKHKVVQEIPSDKPAGVIVQELQPGYTIGGDRILREATVIVSKGE